MSTTRVVDVAALPGAQEADERAAELALRLPAELAPLARIALDYRWSWDPDGDELFRSLDPHAWEINLANPVRQLADIAPHTASRAVGDPATGLPIGPTQLNLKASIAGETHEYTDMYPGMAKAARDEGFEEVADWFETLAKAERSHANRFQKALDAL